MNKLAFSGTIKIPKPITNVKVQKLKLAPGGNPGNEKDWEEQEKQQGPNVVLNQGMSIYAWVHEATSFIGSPHQKPFGDFLKAIYASDDTAPPSPATTALAGTIIKPQTTSVEATDAGLIGGREYTKVSRTATFYQSPGLVNGYTFNKIYGVAPTGVNGAPELAANDSPTTEKLLTSPITITDIETEAVKVVYDLYLPRFGVLANNDFGAEQIGTGSIVLQEKILSDPATSGPTIDWTLVWAPHRDGSSSGSSSASNLASITFDTNSDNKCRIDTNNTGQANVVKTCATSTITRSAPTATSRKLSLVQKLDRSGGTGSSYDIYAINLFNNLSYSSTQPGGSPLMLFFDQAINVDWRQTLEIHVDITFDWS
jgi:hypothetical protein